MHLQRLKITNFRNTLLAKRHQATLTPAEGGELTTLQKYLESLGFTYESRDPLYQLFIEKMYQVKKLPLDKILSKKELARQEKLAEIIVKELITREKIDELSSLAQELKLQVEETP